MLPNPFVHKNRLLFCLLLIESYVCVKSIETINGKGANEVIKDAARGTLEQISPRNELTTQNVEPSRSIGEQRVVRVKNDLENGTDAFRPSVHLGEIEEPRVKLNLFNDALDVKFDHAAAPVSHRAPESPRSVQRGDREDATAKNGQTKFKSDYVKFEDDSVYSIPLPVYANDQQAALQSTAGQGSMTHLNDFKGFGAKRESHDQQLFHFDPNYEHRHEDTPTTFAKPSKFQDEAHDQDQTNIGNFDQSGIAYFVPENYNHYNHYDNYNSDEQPTRETYGAIQKPTSPMVFVSQKHESLLTRTRKFPYQFHPGGYREFGLTEDALAPHPVPRRISPWKKIIHLIGTLLPLGLLLATLTPNVVKIDNTTQPNIILSKLRVDDPVEHKQARLVGDLGDYCEERLICKMILAGGKPRSSLWQNILWNIATRTAKESAMTGDLREVFEAVRKKDCDAIGCRSQESHSWRSPRDAGTPGRRENGKAGKAGNSRASRAFAGPERAARESRSGERAAEEKL